MRRPAVLTAALAATATTAITTIGLVAPAGASAPTPALVGTGSCLGGGHLRLATSIDASRTAKAVVRVSGVKASRWVGQVVAGVDQSTAMSASDAAAATKHITAARGAFADAATHADATTADAVAFYLGAGGVPAGSASCGAMVVSHGGTYVAADVSGAEGLAVVTGHAALDASIAAQAKHRYRASFTLAVPGEVKRFSQAKAATKRGVIDIVVRRVARLASFSHASVTIVDLTDRSVQPMTYSIGR